MSEEQRKSIAVIDGNSLMHRAFHSIPKEMAAPDGTPTNAVFGFLAMLFKFMETYKPDGVICAFDKGKPTFRIEMLEQYKAQRPPTDPNLKTQFPIIQELLTSLEIPVVSLEGWEGDDILGTLAKKGEEAGHEMYLVTGDKDAYQLATKLTKIVTTRRGITDVVIYGPKEVEERYGITPDRVTDFYGLKGDSSDNIPGVPGIGEKTAAKLLGEYDTLENLLDHADEVKGKMGERLREHMEDARVSKKIATISRDVPIELDLVDSKFPTYTPDAVRESFGKYSLNSPLQSALKFLDTGDGSALDVEASHTLELSEPVTGDTALALIEKALKNEEHLGIAISSKEEKQTSLLPEPATMFVAADEGIAQVTIDEDAFIPTLVKILTRGSVSTFDYKALIERVVPRDRVQDASMELQEVNHADAIDITIAAYLLNSSRSTYDLAYLLEKFLSITVPEPTEEIEMGAIEAASARALAPVLLDALRNDGSLPVLRDIEMPLVPVLVQVERNGMMLDTQVLKEQLDAIDERIAELDKKIHELSGNDSFKISSPKQLSQVLFEELGLPPKKKTRTGYSTDAQVLEELSELHEVPGLVLEYRELTKLRSTYLVTLPQDAASFGDERVHTSLNQTVAATGRLSSSDPNLQNIPVRTEIGRAIRKAFVVPDDYVFMSADYSQIELRLLAHLSGDKGLIDAFNHGRDFHTATASRVFNIDADEITPDLRSQAKAVNFGIVYGQQAYGLSQTLKIPFGEAAEMIDRYFEAYPQVRNYLDESIELARKTGHATTEFGRKRRIPELNSRNPNMRGFGERTAMNHPLQGTAADIIKLAMIEVQKRLYDEGLESRMILQVHDELDFEVPVEEVETMTQLVEEVMSGVMDLHVPLEVSVVTASNWADAH